MVLKFYRSKLTRKKTSAEATLLLQTPPRFWRSFLLRGENSEESKSRLLWKWTSAKVMPCRSNLMQKWTSMGVDFSRSLLMQKQRSAEENLSEAKLGASDLAQKQTSAQEKTFLQKETHQKWNLIKKYMIALLQKFACAEVSFCASKKTSVGASKIPQKQSHLKKKFCRSEVLRKFASAEKNFHRSKLAQNWSSASVKSRAGQPLHEKNSVQEN